MKIKTVFSSFATKRCLNTSSQVSQEGDNFALKIEDKQKKRRVQDKRTRKNKTTRKTYEEKQKKIT